MTDTSHSQPKHTEKQHNGDGMAEDSYAGSHAPLPRRCLKHFQFLKQFIQKKISNLLIRFKF